MLTGGYARPVRSEEILRRVDLSILALGDVEALERR